MRMTHRLITHDRHGDHGPWVVFVHGLACARSDWRHQVSALSEGHRCLAVDLRGHGDCADMPGPYDIETLAADLVRLMHALGVDSATLVGHSMGTRVIAAAAMQAPDTVAALVFVDGSRQGSGEPLQARESIAALAGDDVGPAFVTRMFNAMFTGRSSQADRSAIVTRAQAMPISRFRDLIGGMVAWDAGRMPVVLSQLRLPLCVLQSTQLDAERNRVSLQAGQTIPYLDRVREWAPHAEIEVVADSGHFTQLDSADEVTQAIARMVRALHR